MTTLQQWAEADTAPWTKINENIAALSASGIYSKRAPACTGLTWGFHGGFYNGNTIADGTVALTNAATNYVVVLRSSGVVSTSTSSANSTNPLYAFLYELTTAGSVVTVEADRRWAANGLLFSAGGSSTTVATDTIWDAAGDIVVGTGANTAARLAAGTNGHVLTLAAGTPAWQAPSAGSGTKTYAVFTPMTSQPPATNYATLDTRNSIAVLDFDDTTEESIFWVFVMPEAASLASGLIVNIFFMASTATSGDARFGVQFERMNTDLDSDSFDTATEATVATNGTSGIVTKLAITCTAIDSLAAGELYRLKIYRDTSGADTITGDVEVVAVELRSAA